MNNKLSEQEVIDKYLSRRRVNASVSDEIWVILFEGKPIKLTSGKSTWRKKNHASSALTISLRYLYSRYQDGWELSEVTKLLQEKGIIEIKQLW